ncbi:MAG TPA: hypothetical protein VK501_22000 [Baekduia sp.]|uniref:hypothetical protein n=1 Tax=Baekduia sp. TaxID=2600305 RepID=UPI002BEA1201|nr:hypothetical protein [Baekduia sp.]HMJ36593.1 hypothetical protein [Baekduia sp.]
MAATYRVILRRRGRTEKTSHDSAEAALDALEHELRVAVTRRQPRVERVLGREYEPVQQVAVRGELRGPRGLRAGIDVRGDGSAEAFTGRVRRVPIPQGEREDAWAALRRVVADAAY